LLGNSLLGIFVLPLLLYLPGLLLSWANSAFLPSDSLERHYERVISSALLNGWLALLLAEVGFFSLWLHLLILMLLCVFLFLKGRKQLRECQITIQNRGEILTFVLIALIALILNAQPFETILGARDAGVYANAGFAIARTGSIVQYDPLIEELGQAAQTTERDTAQQALSNFLGVQHQERYIATRLRVAGFLINAGDIAQGRIIPQHFHLFPAWIALLTTILGWKGGLFASGLLGFLGLWSVGMLGRRLAGGWVGGLAMLFLALNSVQVWFSRYSTSETTTQWLIFTGLYCFTKLNQTQNSSKKAQILYAALAGIAFGQLALTRIDFFLGIGPVLAYLLYSWLSHRWKVEQTTLLLFLSEMLLHASLHIVFIARSYFFDTAFARLQDFALTSYFAMPFLTPILREVYHTTSRSPLKDPLRIWRELIALSGFLTVILLLWQHSKIVYSFEKLLQRWQSHLKMTAAISLILLAIYGYFIRPGILNLKTIAAMPQCLSNEQIQNPTDSCLALQGYIGAPIALPTMPPGRDSKYAIPLANLVRVGWYLSPLGILAGILGFALWLNRGWGRDSWLFFVVGFLGIFFYVRDTYGTSDQSYIYILRRFVPIAYPTFSLGIAFFLVNLARKTNLGKISAAILTTILLIFFVWTGKPIYQHSEYRGAIDQIQQFAAQFKERDILLFRGGAPTYNQARDIPDLVVTPLRFMFGLNAFAVKSKQPGAYAEALTAQLRHWQAQKRTVYVVLGASGGDFALAGLILQPVGKFELRVPEFEQLTDQKPHNVAELALSFTIYRLEAGKARDIATLPNPITITDFAAQVNGFYHPEQSLESKATYAWTNGDAILRLRWPQAQASTQLALTVAGGSRPAHLGPAQLCLSLLPENQPWPATGGKFTSLGCITLKKEVTTYQFPLSPFPHLSQAPTSALLRLESPTWVPAFEDSQQHDRRSLGVQFTKLTFISPE